MVARFGQLAASDELLKWYLRDRYFDVEEAADKLSSMLKWRQGFIPDGVTKEDVTRELASGKAYVHTNTDVYGRPVIVIRVKAHTTGEYPVAGSKKMAVYIIEQALAQLPLGGEQIMGVFDLRGFDFTRNADLVFARFLVDAFFEYFPRRVAQVAFVEAPWVFYPAWEIIKPILRKYAALVRFVSVDELRIQFFTPATVPADFKK